MGAQGCLSLPGSPQSLLLGGGQDVSCLVVAENGGAGPPLSDRPGSVNTRRLPSAFLLTCWLTLLLWVGKIPFILYMTVHPSELDGL